MVAFAYCAFQIPFVSMHFQRSAAPSPTTCPAGHNRSPKPRTSSPEIRTNLSKAPQESRQDIWATLTRDSLSPVTHEVTGRDRYRPAYPDRVSGSDRRGAGRRQH